MIIVTSGNNFLDIDGYGAAVAYAELLRRQGSEARAVTSAVFNDSVPSSFRDLPVQLDHTQPTSLESDYVLVDISEPKYFDRIVDHDRIKEIIDHHPGFESYWAERDVAAQIEQIGAACTMVYERWAQAGGEKNIDKHLCTLLAAGILDNTLNFGAAITTQRDRDAYADLQKTGSLAGDFASSYFTECQQSIERDVAAALKNDTKPINYPGYEDQLMVGQLAVWDASSFVERHGDTLWSFLEEHTGYINLISISESKSYLLCADAKVQEFLHQLLGSQFKNNVSHEPRMWLRKEIMAACIKQTQ